MNKLPIYIGIFFLSIATLLFEISLTRIFSVTQWYHFAFMVVSIALFGFGASGTFLYVFPSLLKKNTDKMLFFFSLFFTLTLIMSFIVTNRVLFDPYKVAWDPKQVAYILLYYLILGIPFFASGTCIAIVFTNMAEDVAKVYFFNLVGSGIGSLLILGAFKYFGSGVVIFSSLIGLFSVFSFSINLPRKNTISALILLTILTYLLLNPIPIFDLNLSPYKGLNEILRYPNSKILETHWNAFSRVDVVRSPAIRYAPGLSYIYRKDLPEQIGIVIDGDTVNALTRFKRNMRDIEFIDYLPTSLAYKLLKNKLKKDKLEEKDKLEKGGKVLIINPTGGLSVLTAIYYNFSHIDAVEINPIVVDILKNRYDEFTGELYNDERVNVYVEEGRSYVRRSKESYDLIEIPLTDSFGASSTGVYSLSENYIFTTEAFEDYYTHLSEDGLLSITRWLLPPPREDIRLLSLAISALNNQGVSEPENHIAIIRSWGTFTFLMSKSEFNKEEIREIKEFCKKRRFDIVYYPGVEISEVNIYNKFSEPIYYEAVRRILSEGSSFYEEYLFDVSPVNDDKPYFFHFFRWKKIVPLYKSMGEKWQPFIEGGYLIPVVFFQALILSIFFILLPLYKLKRTENKSNKLNTTKKSNFKKWRILAYFISLGLGYMLIEIALIQRFILFLGHPIYAFSVVVFSLLLFSGIGSYFSDRIEMRYLVPVIFSISIVVFLYTLFLSDFFYHLLGKRILVRFLSSISVLMIPGVLMGIPFPRGISLLKEIEQPLIPWAWSANACASVLGSVLSIMLAMSFGFSTVLFFAGTIYIVAALTISRILS